MKVSKALLWAFPLSLLSSWSASAVAETIRLEMLPVDGPGTGCPTAVVAYETLRPRTEGGFVRDGMVQLAAIATNISATQLDDFSATWVGTLKPEYRTCKASAGMTSVDGDSYTGHSYIRAQLMDGQVKVILDMTGMRDPNGFTTTLVEQTIREGNPRWTWGGTD